MIEVIILAIALSMDALAVSIGLGAKKGSVPLALKAGLFFGIFQALMPFVGYWGGKSILGWIAHYTHWIAFVLLALIGAKMIYEGFQEGEDEIAEITNQTLLALAIATSIDAMAAGFGLMLLDVSPAIACFTIGIITFALSAGGVLIGKNSAAWLEGKAEIFGGVVLILMGIKFLIF